MRRLQQPGNLPRSIRAPRRPQLLLTALLLGGTSILAACNMTAHQSAAMKYSFPGTSDSYREQKWADMSGLQQRYVVERYENLTGAKPPAVAEVSAGEGGGGGDGGGGGGGGGGH